MSEPGDSQQTNVVRLMASGAAASESRAVPVEMPVSITVNGIGHAVMMATPKDLEDFAHGFALSDGLVQRDADILGVEMHPAEPGLILKLEIAAERFAPFADRVRAITGASGCGLCGVINLEQAIRPLPVLAAKPVAGAAAIFRALAAMSAHQILNAATGAVHAAAFCSADGDILAVREDIGRHNAFDKLIGHLMRKRVDPAQGFALLTSRCSYELVEKAVLGGIVQLATISAPTTLAIARAQESRLTLVSLARPDSLLVVNDPWGLFPAP